MKAAVIFLVMLVWSVLTLLWVISSSSTLAPPRSAVDVAFAALHLEQPSAGGESGGSPSYPSAAAPLSSNDGTSNRSAGGEPAGEAAPGGGGARPRYHDVPEPALPRKSWPMTTAYHDSTVVRSAPWFRPRRICRAGCCAETVAISLDQDDRRIKNTADGLDLADAMLRGHRLSGDHLTFHAAVLDDKLLPCLQPGTIIHADSYGTVLKRFFYDYRPQITVPYLFISSETDGPMPMPLFRPRLEEDSLLIHWYGNNPDLGREPVKPIYREKFTGFNLGLSRQHTQMPYLTHYLKVRNFTNPFAGEANKRRWTESVELRNAIDTTPVLFVKFGINRLSQHRREPMAMACEGRTTDPKDNITCTGNDKRFSVHQTYAAASHYLFGLSPPGNGRDCYRTYELLILGVIPVVKEVPEYKNLFQGLPIVQLKHWDYSQAELLKIFRDYVSSDAFRTSNFDGWERLFLRYWRRKMLAQTGRDKDIVRDSEGREYYQAWHYTLYHEPLITIKWPLDNKTAS